MTSEPDAPQPERREGTASMLLTGMADLWNGLRAKTRGPGDGLGLLLMVASAASFALMAALAKLFLPETPTTAIVFWRGAFMTLIFVTWARTRGVSLISGQWKKLLLRGVLGAGAVYCYFISVKLLPLGDAVLIQYSHPVFVAALAPFVLKERTTRIHWPLVLAAFLGLALVVNSSASIQTKALVGVMGSFMSGLAYMTVRTLSRTEPAARILVWFTAITVPASLAVSLIDGTSLWPADTTTALGHALVTICALTGQIALTEGLRRAGAARATAVTMAGPIFGQIFGAWLFGTWPTPLSLVGGALVLSALIALALQESGEAQTKNDGTPKVVPSSSVRSQ